MNADDTDSVSQVALNGFRAYIAFPLVQEVVDGSRIVSSVLAELIEECTDIGTLVIYLIKVKVCKQLFN